MCWLPKVHWAKGFADRLEGCLHGKVEVAVEVGCVVQLSSVELHLGLRSILEVVIEVYPKGRNRPF